MVHTEALQRPRPGTGWALLAWLGLCNAVGIVSALASSSGDSPWYLSLEKPSFNPPSWVFGPVWTTLYVMMAVAAWRVWRDGGFARHGTALTLFLVQLALNFAWSFLFFRFHQLELALIEIVLLWLAIAATIAAFRRIDRPAAWLMVPYLAWVTFATILTAAIVRLN